MKLILALTAATMLSGCAQGYYPQKATGMEYSGVGMGYGVGLTYSRPQGGQRELSKAERDYIAANRVDFGAIQKANEEANAEIYAKEKAELRQQTGKMSCEDIAAIGYQVLVNKAWSSGDWASVNNYDTKSVIARCHANTGK